MKKIIILLGVLVLAGCVNPYAYREEQTVQASFTTKKGVEETQQCILAAWQRVPLLTAISAQQTGRYYSVLAIPDAADVLDESGQTRVNYYSLRGALDVTNGKEKRIAGIKSCL